VKQPPLIESRLRPPVLEKKRYHDLDALRAFAMLLGIVLHGVISFFPNVFWPAKDLHRPEVEVPAVLAAPLEQAGFETPQSVNLYEMVLHAIHGFRLPLFFWVSGFFTTMLWKNIGLFQLAQHRAIRILFPLAIFLPIIWALHIPVGMYGDQKREQVRKLRRESDKIIQQKAKPPVKYDPQSPVDIRKAAANGDLEAIHRHINSGTDLNQRAPDQSTPLITAATFGRMEVVRSLIAAGVDLDKRDQDGSTALLRASFFAHLEMVESLLEAGADPNISKEDGTTALDTVQAPWDESKGIYEWVSEMMGPDGPDLDYDRIRETRPKIAAILRENGAVKGERGEAEADLEGLVMLVFFAGIFHHLWFLYYLAWLVAGFIIIMWLLGKLKWRALPEWLITSPLAWLWLLPVTFLAQMMMDDSFGPATATGFLPWPPILIYYAIFFFFGALCFGCDSFETKVGRLWPLSFVLAVAPLLAGLCLVKSQNDGALLAAFSVVYAWLMIFGFIGFFRAFFSGENARIRYLSDSSYWLYIMHLPLIIFVQLFISSWDMSSILKCLLTCVGTTLILLVSYEWGVRYTCIGTLLNGKRTRNQSMV